MREDYSGARQREVTKVLKPQVDCSWSEAKWLMEHAPMVVKASLKREEAEVIKLALGTAGVQISIRLK